MMGCATSSTSRATAPDGGAGAASKPKEGATVGADGMVDPTFVLEHDADGNGDFSAFEKMGIVSPAGALGMDGLILSPTSGQVRGRARRRASLEGLPPPDIMVLWDLDDTLIPWDSLRDTNPRLFEPLFKVNRNLQEHLFGPRLRDLQMYFPGVHNIRCFAPRTSRRRHVEAAVESSAKRAAEAEALMPSSGAGAGAGSGAGAGAGAGDDAAAKETPVPSGGGLASDAKPAGLTVSTSPAKGEAEATAAAVAMSTERVVYGDVEGLGLDDGDGTGAVGSSAPMSPGKAALRARALEARGYYSQIEKLYYQDPASLLTPEQLERGNAVRTRLEAQERPPRVATAVEVLRGLRFGGPRYGRGESDGAFIEASGGMTEEVTTDPSGIERMRSPLSRRDAKTGGAEGVRVANVIVTGSRLLPAVSKVMLFGLAEVVHPADVHSVWMQDKTRSFDELISVYGVHRNNVLAVGDGDNEAAASKRLGISFQRCTHSSHLIKARRTVERWMAEIADGKRPTLGAGGPDLSGGAGEPPADLHSRPRDAEMR